jgi:hypothetical protein
MQEAIAKMQEAVTKTQVNVSAYEHQHICAHLLLL